MSRQIREAEWRLFRELRAIALERFCERVLSEVAAISTDAGKTAHERYLAIFKLIDQRDDELAGAFNNPRRSTAMHQLAAIKYLKLLTDDEMARFSPETCNLIELLTTLGD